MSACRGRAVLLDNLAWEDGEDIVEFRLTYDGPLLASNGGRDSRPARKEHKRAIRNRFHSQLRRLWQTVPHLRAGRETSGLGYWSSPSTQERPRYDMPTLAAKYNLYGWNFVPLVTQDLQLSCWLDILYLRRQKKGDLFVNGDIDNRIKTLFDCLQIPDAHQEYQSIAPDADETPFFCLLENDKLISKITVETDLLLEDIRGQSYDEHDARLVITVRIRPYEMSPFNLQFG
jgi:hypothetical protein